MLVNLDRLLLVRFNRVVLVRSNWLSEVSCQQLLVVTVMWPMSFSLRLVSGADLRRLVLIRGHSLFSVYTHMLRRIQRETAQLAYRTGRTGSGPIKCSRQARLRLARGKDKRRFRVLKNWQPSGCSVASSTPKTGRQEKAQREVGDGPLC
jgi:hypothetical protein